VIIRKGENEIPGLTDSEKPRRLGPKRANNIRKLFALTKEDDVRQFVIRRQVVRDGKKSYYKAPKIQRLVTPERLQRKRRRKAELRGQIERSRKAAEIYNDKIARKMKKIRDQKRQESERRRSKSRLEST